jgi:hypothetical protein
LKIVVDFVSRCDILEFVQLKRELKMRGFIIMLVSFLIVFGAVGGIEVNPDADLLTLMIIAIGGLIGMLIGVSVIREDA